MKQKVIIFTGKSQTFYDMKGNEKTKGLYDRETLERQVNRWFPSHIYDVEIVDYPRCRYYYDINLIWMRVRMPIIIGYDIGASYIEPIKNYKRKYLISPLSYCDTRGYYTEITEYDKENTYAFFGDNKKSKKFADEYSKSYPNTFTYETNGILSFADGFDYVGMFECFSLKGEMDAKRRENQNNETED